ITDLRRALEITPRMARVRVELARRLAAAGNADEADALLAEGVRRRPWDAQQRLEYVNLLLALGRGADAETHARAAIDEIEKTKEGHRAVDPAFAMRLLAQTLITQNKPDEALATLDRVLELQPDNPEPPTVAAQILVRQRRVADAAKYLDLAEGARDRLIEQQRQHAPH